MTHLSTQDLLRAAERSALTAETSEHLTTCIACTARARWLERLRRSSAALPPLGVLELEKTPRVAPARSGRAGHALRGAAIAILALGGATLFFRGSQLDGQASELRFLDADTQAGTRARLEYAPAPGLAALDSVVVRARFRSRDDRRSDPTLPAVTAGVLHRAESGRFRGSVSIPPDAVYGVFTMESAGGGHVDSNQRRLWERTIRGPGGPRASLQQAVNDLLARNWEEAAATQRAMAEADPTDALAWSGVFFLDQELVPHRAVDSLRAWHRDRFSELEAHHLRPPALTGDVAGAMFWYAIGVENSVAVARWRGLLVDRFPRHPRAVEQRTLSIAREAAEPTTALREMERLWQEVGPAHAYLPQSAALLAMRVEDPAAVERWLDRYVLLRPEAALWAAGTLTRFEQTRARGLAWLRDEVARLERFEDRARPLELSTAEFRRRSADQVASGMHRLATALLAAGDTSGAEPLLRRAVEVDWHTRSLESLAALAASRGDSAEATTLLARAAADPVSGLGVDSAQAALGAAFAGSVWPDALSGARRELFGRVLSGSRSVALPGGIRLEDTGGTEHALVEITGGRPSVIAFWSPFCGPSLDLLPDLQALSDRLRARGAALVLVTTEPLNATARTALQDRGVTVRAYTDAAARLRTALESWRTPDLYVVDGDGRLRFNASDMNRVERQIAAVTASSR